MQEDELPRVLNREVRRSGQRVGRNVLDRRACESQIRD